MSPIRRNHRCHVCCQIALFVFFNHCFTETSTSSNTILYIGRKLYLTSKSENHPCVLVAVGGIVLVFVLICCCCCCFGGGFMLWEKDKESKAPIRPARSQRRQDRTSVDSTASDATYWLKHWLFLFLNSKGKYSRMSEQTITFMFPFYFFST